VPLAKANHSGRIKWSKGASVDLQAAVQGNGARSGWEWANHGSTSSKDQLLPAPILGDEHVSAHRPGPVFSGIKSNGYRHIMARILPPFRPQLLQTRALTFHSPPPSPVFYCCALPLLQPRPCPKFSFSLPRARHSPLRVIVTLSEHLHVHSVPFTHSLVVQEHV
jgi:hypothetical protein